MRKSIFFFLAQNIPFGKLFKEKIVLRYSVLPNGQNLENAHLDRFRHSKPAGLGLNFDEAAKSTKIISRR